MKRLRLAALLLVIGVTASVADLNADPADAGAPSASGSLEETRLKLSGEFEAAAAPARIVLRIRPQRFRPLYLRLIDVPLQCDDGTLQRRSLTLQGELRRSGRFRIAKYFGPSFGADVRAYVDLDGRLERRGLATGTFTLLSVSFESFSPSCATSRPLRWRAVS